MSPAAKTVVFEAMDRVLACRPMERQFRSKQPRPPDLVDLSEASGISGISRQNMKKLMSAHFFEVKRGGHRGLTRWVKRSDVMAVAAELNATIPDFAVEKQLGIDRQQFCLLEAAGLLVRPTSALRPLLPTGTHYTAASVEALLVRLHRPLDDKVFAVPISEAALALSMAPVPWAAILIVVATEAGYGVTAAKGSSDWRASTLVTDVERFKIDVKKAADAFPVANQILSTAGAAEILGTTPNFVRRIAKLGVLRNLQGRPARFERQSIVCFRKEYIYGNALARHFGVSNNNAIRRRLANQNVYPAFPDLPRDIIFNRIGLPASLD